MPKLKLCNGVVYPIEDYATPNCFVVILEAMAASEVLETMTEENLSRIQFLTDGGTITGIYSNKLLCGYTENQTKITVNINDADLCRYGLALNAENRIINVYVKRDAPANVIIVGALPGGNITDYRYIDGEYIYDPLPNPEPAEPSAEGPVWDELDAAYQRGVDSV